MYCPNCGKPNEDNSYRCTGCDHPLQPGNPRIRPEDIPQSYLVGSVILMAMCCLPIGIMSAVYGARVNSYLLSGDLEGARASSRKARLWLIAGLGFTGLVWLVIIALMVTGFSPQDMENLLK